VGTLGLVFGGLDLGRLGDGHGKVWDAGTSNIRDARGKVGGKWDIASFVKMCYLWSPLDSIVQNHIGHIMMFTQNISLYRSKCTDYLD